MTLLRDAVVPSVLLQVAHRVGKIDAALANVIILSAVFVPNIHFHVLIRGEYVHGELLIPNRRRPRALMRARAHLLPPYLKCGVSAQRM